VSGVSPGQEPKEAAPLEGTTDAAGTEPALLGSSGAPKSGPQELGSAGNRAIPRSSAGPQPIVSEAGALVVTSTPLHEPHPVASEAGAAAATPTTAHEPVSSPFAAVAAALAENYQQREVQQPQLSNTASDPLRHLPMAVTYSQPLLDSAEALARGLQGDDIISPAPLRLVDAVLPGPSRIRPPEDGLDPRPQPNLSDSVDAQTPAAEGSGVSNPPPPASGLDPKLEPTQEGHLHSTQEESPIVAGGLQTGTPVRAPLPENQSQGLLGAAAPPAGVEAAAEGARAESGMDLSQAVGDSEGLPAAVASLHERSLTKPPGDPAEGRDTS
jgi:hypothetical protein